MRLRTLARRASKTTVGVEPFSGVDGQGSPSYNASQNIEAFEREATEFGVDADGSDVRFDLVLHVPGDESPLPSEKDRLTVDGTTYIVRETSEGKALDGTIDHVKVMAVDE